MWHFAISRLVMVARANGLRPIDGPFGDISDPAGFEAQARRSAALGCEGKWAIHPSQVDLANRLLGPGAEEVRKAEGILRAMEDAQRDGQGAVCYEGRMIDLASVRQAEILVKKAAEISARDC
jgi:malyl-CoA/(S)-citramalyl-CoA lyase